MRLAAVFAAAAAAFVASQVLTAVHDAKFGDGPHEHGGQTCVLALVSAGGDKLVAGSTMAIAISIITWGVVAFTSQTERARVLVRAARPRGPPNR